MRILPAALIALVALAGCGNEVAQEAAERSSDPVVAAAGRVADEESARIALSVTAGGGPEVTGEGVFDLVDGDAGRLTMTLPGPDGAPVTQELLVVDGTVYQRGPMWGDDRWVRLDDEALGTQGPADPGSVLTQDPVAMIRLLEDATDLTEAGPVAVRGVPAQRWTGTIDLAALAEASDAAVAVQLRELGLERVPVEVAVDDEGRLVRAAFTLDLAAIADTAAEPAPPQVTVAVELFDFGAPVDVQAPPPEEVVDASALLEAQPS